MASIAFIGIFQKRSNLVFLPGKGKIASLGSRCCQALVDKEDEESNAKKRGNDGRGKSHLEKIPESHMNVFL
ncbi:MAG: hypothetical protein PGMFKBFP_01584 [Anaerolineales bacterium]|nr:hypothetical protein [Anaerolineales bacterium]